MNGLLDFLQQASRSAGQSVTGLVDLGALAMRPLGYNVPMDRVLGSTAWAERKGLLAPESQTAAGIAGQTFGGLLAPLASAKAPQIAAGLNQAGANLAAHQNLNPQAGVIKVGSSWAGKNPPSVEKLAKHQDKFLYHSDVAKNIDDLHYGIEPQQGGPWVREVAQGATDDVDDFLGKTTPLAWFSDQPTWVKIKVARELKKPLKQVTDADIEKVGHLALVNKKDPYLEKIWRVGDEGLMDGSYSKVTDLKGNKVKAYQTDIYQDGLEPFGVERNEWIATEAVEPFVQLTGKDLLEYLSKISKRGLLNP